MQAVAGNPEREALSDPEVLALARAEHRAVVTSNLRDFRPLHHEAITPGGPGHFGVIFRPGSYRRTRAGSGRIIAALEGSLAQYPGEGDLANGEEKCGLGYSDFPASASWLARRKMWTPRAVAVACGLAVGLAAASCGRPITRPIIDSARLVGTWTSSDGATLTFRAGQTVTARNLRLPMVPGCDHVSAAGTWQFLSLQGDSPGPGQAYPKSNLISVDFSEQAVEVCSSEFTTWKDGPLTMCLDLDPDSPCSDPVFTKDAAPN